MSTIAQNHLSKFGRFGDTEIAETASGELWHVNKGEKKLMDEYGSEGEKLVDYLGAGTINPVTGLKEQFALEAATIGLSVYQGAKQSQKEREMARDSLAVLQDQYADLDKQDEQIVKTKDAKMEAAMSDFNLSAKDIGSSFSEAWRGFKLATEKSGLQTTKGGNKKALWDQFGREEVGLNRKLGIDMGEVEGWFEERTADIDSQRKSMENQMKVLSAAANKPKFLGLV